MKTVLRIFCVLVALASRTSAQDSRSVLSADVSVEVKDILRDYDFVGGPSEWYHPHQMENDGKHISWGSALCVFREPSKPSLTGQQEEVTIPPASGLRLVTEVLEGFCKRFKLNASPAGGAIFARTDIEDGEASAETMIEWTSDQNAATGTKSSTVITARFVSLRGGKFGILLNYTQVW